MFPFLLLFSSYFHNSIFQINSTSTSINLLLVTSRIFFNFNNWITHFVCLTFVSSMSLVMVLIMLIASWIFFILFLRLWNIFTIILLNYFSESLSIFLHIFFCLFFLFFSCCSYYWIYVNLLYLPLCNFVFYSFFLSLSFFTMFTSLFCSHFFFPQLAHCFDFVFQFML